jgi:acetyl esterase/lipase
VTKKVRTALAADGHQIPIYEYRAENEGDENKGEVLQPAVLYIHGGGMILGSPEMFEQVTMRDVVETGVVHFSV